MLLEKIRAMQTDPHSTLTERLISDFLIKNGSEITQIGIREFAKRAGVSPGSIMRYTHRLGFRGYAEFRVQFNLDYLASLENEITDTQRLEALSRQLTKNLTYDINTFNSTLDFGVLELAIKRMQKASRIAIFADNNLLEAAYPFRSAMLSIGHNVSLESTSENKINDALGLNSNDFAIVILREKDNPLFIEIAEALHLNNVPYLCLSHIPNGIVQDAADFLITLPEPNRMTFENLTISFTLDLILAGYQMF